MTYKTHKGWYKLLNPEKFIAPLDNYMGSYKDGHVQYKSKLELITIKYADFNKHIINWSLEPFHIKYIKPTDNKTHRYFVDFYFKFSTGEQFLVEIKSKGETILPKVPKKQTDKTVYKYQQALITYHVNQAKWNAAREFAESKKMKFIVLTEEQLKP